jgi:hypothetical protein
MKRENSFHGCLLVQARISARMKIEFLALDDCENAPKLRKALQDALQALRQNIIVSDLDLTQLSMKNDNRAGYGSPTILVNGKDLFDTPIPNSFEPACRYYPSGLPKASEIVVQLKKFGI